MLVTDFLSNGWRLFSPPACWGQYSWGPIRAWSLLTLSSPWGGRWNSWEKSWSWWNNSETWELLSLSLSLLEVNSPVLALCPQFVCVLRWVGFYPSCLSSEHREQTEGGSSWRPRLLPHGRGGAMPSGQSHSPTLRGQHPCALACCGTSWGSMRG